MEKPYTLVLVAAALVVGIFFTTLIGIYAFSKGVTWLSVASLGGTMLIGELHACKFLPRIITGKKY